MRMTLLTPFLLLALALGFGTAAHADTSKVFQLSGGLHSGATLSGTVTIDTTTGQVSAVNISVNGEPNTNYKPYNFTQIDQQGTEGFAWVVYTSSGQPGDPVFVFGERTTPNSLKNYPGGPLGPKTVLKFSNGAIDPLVGGFLTLAPAN